jgi:hypothetical protein
MKHPFLSLALSGLFIVSASLSGCVTQMATEALTLPSTAMELRSFQTRRFDTSNENSLLEASLAVLQDLGFSIDESESGLGVLVASKNREASDVSDFVGSVMIGGFGGADAPYDVEQKIRASVVTRTVSPHSVTVRVTFQRTVWNNKGEVSRNESIEDPHLYQEFFSKLSKSVFLTAHDV